MENNNKAVSIDEDALDKAIMDDVSNVEAEKKDEFIFKPITNTRPNVKVSGATFENYQMALGYYKKKEFDKALEFFTKAAEGKHSPSMYQLGLMYSRAEGVEQDYLKAVEWFKKAIKNDGDMDSVYSLAVLYFYGRGVEMNKRKAFDLFHQCAFCWHADSQAMLSAMYITGTDGIEPSMDFAFEWAQRGYKNGSISAGYTVGTFMLKGIATKVNVPQAISILTDIADRNFPEACYDLASFYANGEYVEKDKEKAFMYAKKGHELKKEKASVLYAQFLIEGTGCESNVQKGLSILEELVNSGYVEASLALANNYLFVKYVEPNPEKAVSLLKPLLEHKDENIVFNAKFFIALMLHKYDVTQYGVSYQEAVEYLELCEQNTNSLNPNDFGLLYASLAEVYFNNKHYKQDLKKYSAYLTKSASYGNAVSMQTLADNMMKGINGFSKDEKKAFELLIALDEINNSAEIAKKIAECYRDGIGVKKGITNAKKYAKRYAELSNQKYADVEKEMFPKNEN